MSEPIMSLRLVSTRVRDFTGPYTAETVTVDLDVTARILRLSLYQAGESTRPRFRLDFTGTRDLQALVEALTAFLGILKAAP